MFGTAPGHDNNLFGIATDGKDTLFIGCGSGDVYAFECGKKFGFRMKLQGYCCSLLAPTFSAVGFIPDLKLVLDIRLPSGHWRTRMTLS